MSGWSFILTTKAVILQAKQNPLSKFTFFSMLDSVLKIVKKWVFMSRNMADVWIVDRNFKLLKNPLLNFLRFDIFVGIVFAFVQISKSPTFSPYDVTYFLVMTEFLFKN